MRDMRPRLREFGNAGPFEGFDVLKPLAKIVVYTVAANKKR
jgi:hypothetical protein